MTLQEIQNQALQLPIGDRWQLVEVLLDSLRQENQSEATPITSSSKRGGLGIWKDKIWIANDFDAPLDDFQEYMS